jgi:hypothetical protein
VGLRWRNEDKVVRKRVGAPAGVRSIDPAWNAKFTFVVSLSRLCELVLQVRHVFDLVGCFPMSRAIRR